MIKTLSNIFKQDKEKFVIPRSVQQVIPIETIWSDGIFKIGRNKFARTYKFTDINYAVASKVDKETMFLEYMDLLNSFDCGGTTKITINNRRLNKVDFEKAILIPMQEDGLDLYRKEYNNMLLDKATSSNSMVQEKYVTVSCYKKTIEEARTYFARVTTELNSHFARLSSKCAEVNGEDKLRILHDFYRTGEESGFHFDIQENMRKGHSFKDYICPDTFEFEKDYFRMGDRYGRVLFLREYIKLALQSYNYGNGYLEWAKARGGYTLANAAEFSDMMAQRMGWNSYGDKQYVPHVLQYYAFGRIPTGIGNQAIVQVAASQEGKGGTTYWSWYGFGSRVEWCACFVSWCADQSGYIQSGVIPKFSLCSDGVRWFESKGRFRDASYTPAVGDIIFFDWGNNGTIDHVGIVESVSGGTVNTIEGNSGDKVARRNYSIGSSNIYGYGVPAY